MSDSKFSSNKSFGIGTGRLKIRVTVSEVLAIGLMFSIIIAVTIASVNNNTIYVMPRELVISYVIMGVLGSIGLVSSSLEYPFSLSQIHWLFYMLFFTLPSISQYLNGYRVWGYSLTKNDYLTTNITLIIWGILFLFITLNNERKYEMQVYEKKGTKKVKNDMYHSFPAIKQSRIIVLISISLFVMILVFTMAGPVGITSRNEYRLGLSRENALLFEKFVRPIPVYAFLILFANWKKKAISLLPLAIVGICVIVSNFPTGMARNVTAGTYGGLLLSCSRKLHERKNFFPLLFIILYLLVFPAQGTFRYSTVEFSAFISAITQSFNNISKCFLTVDYDAYSMLARTIRYVLEHGIVWGRQFLGVILFFVPRRIWPLKPGGSGDFIGTAQSQTILNISCPLPAEAILNFGLAGLICVAVIVGLLCNICNRSYWLKSSQFIYYPYLCMMFFFIMRGDLLSSLSFTIGMGLSCHVVYAIAYTDFSELLHKNAANRK